MCKICGIIGITSINSGTPYTAKRPKKARPQKVHYNFGNNVAYIDRSLAKEELLERYYTNIHRLKNITAEDFQPGMIGIAKLPKVLRVTKIPKAVDLSNQQKLANLNLKESIVKQESSESVAINGIEKYFDFHSNEDAFIMATQDLQDPIDNTWHERDIFIINLSRGYVLNLEVKSVLEDTKSWKKSSKPAHVQLQKTMEILTNHFENPLVLQQEWKVINLVYASKVDPNFNICTLVNEFIITENDDFNSKLTLILETHAPLVNSYSYVKDFYLMVSELLPERVRICTEMVQTFQKPVNEAILGKVTKNVEDEAGSVLNIAYWSHDQFDIVANSKILKRVLFESAFSTGKTLLMMECARQLLLDGDKVLFIIRSEASNDYPTLLNFKIQGFFQGKKNFKIIQSDFKNEDTVKDIITKHNDHHIFVDELANEYNNVLTIDVTIDSIVQWSQLANQDKHFWVVIGYGKGYPHFDRDKLALYFYIPFLKYPLRNPKEVVELVKSVIDGLGRLSTYDYGGFCMSQLEVPNNLTNTFKPHQIVADNYGDGFKRVLDALDQTFSDYIPALFLFGYTTNVDVKVFKCQCYDGDNLTSNYVLLKNYINTIFHQRNNRPQPIQYWGSSKDKAKDWILKSKDNDLITQIYWAFGFEHNLVVVFQSQDPQHFDINSCMRSTAMLIVVNMPVQQLNNWCLGKCREGTSANANT